MANISFRKAFAGDIYVKEIFYNSTIERGVNPLQVFEDKSRAWMSSPSFFAFPGNIWVKIAFEAKGISSAEDFVLEVEDRIPYKAEFTLFDEIGKNIDQTQSSQVNVNSVRSTSMPPQLKENIHGQRFRLLKDGRYTFVVQLSTPVRTHLDLKFKKYSDYKDAHSYQIMFLALAIGGLIAMLLHNLILWKSLDRNIFFKISILNFYFLAWALCSSHAVVYMSSRFSANLPVLFSIIPFVALGQLLSFSLDYLRIRFTNGISTKLIKWASHAMHIVGVFSIITPGISAFVQSFLYPVGYLVLLSVLIKMSKQKHALLMLCATLPLSVLVVMSNTVYGISVSNSYVNALPLALFLVMLLLAAGMANRLSEIRNQLVQSISDRAKELEKLVTNKTQEINQKNLELFKEVEDRKLAEIVALEQKELLQSAQARIISSSRLTALGEMATGISHEINNPLTILKGYTHLILENLKKSDFSADKVKSLAEKSLATIERMSNVIRGLREFSQEDSSDEPIPVSLKQCLDTVSRLCRTRVESLGIDLGIEGFDEEMIGIAKPADLVQVMLSCITNSCDALAGKKESWIKITANHDAKYLNIKIVDSGRGLCQSVSGNIFTPFCTTKRRNELSGLSLSVGKQLMIRVGGDLRYLPEQSNTTFEISILRADMQQKAVG